MSLCSLTHVQLYSGSGASEMQQITSFLANARLMHLHDMSRSLFWHPMMGRSTDAINSKTAMLSAGEQHRCPGSLCFQGYTCEHLAQNPFLHMVQKQALASSPPHRTHQPPVTISMSRKPFCALRSFHAGARVRCSFMAARLLSPPLGVHRDPCRCHGIVTGRPELGRESEEG